MFCVCPTLVAIWSDAVDDSGGGHDFADAAHFILRTHATEPSQRHGRTSGQRTLAYSPELATRVGQRSIQYVDDLVEGIWRLLQSGHTGPINIGNPCEVSIYDLAKLVRDLIGSKSPIVNIARTEDDPRVRRPDITLSRELLDWEPQVGLSDGLKSTIEYFQGLAVAT